jgi:hypothetical protein
MGGYPPKTPHFGAVNGDSHLTRLRAYLGIGETRVCKTGYCRQNQVFGFGKSKNRFSVSVFGFGIEN